MKATLLLHGSDDIGEAATWLSASQTFLWVDINSCLLHEYIPSEAKHYDHHLPDMASTIIPTNNKEEVILALKGNLVLYNLKTRYLKYLLELEKDQPELRPNDGKASPDGRIWLGIMHLTNHQSTGGLYRINSDLSIKKILDHQCIPNGIVWNKAGTLMYYVDSGRNCIEEYKYDSKDGEIKFVRVAIKVPPQYGTPDGMTIDNDDLLWVAHWGGFGVYIWNPETGELVDKIDVPVPNVSSCTFCGKELKQLYITTARAGLSVEEIIKYPLSGSLFIAQVRIKAGENHYQFIKK